MRMFSLLAQPLTPARLASPAAKHKRMALTPGSDPRSATSWQCAPPKRLHLCESHGPHLPQGETIRTPPENLHGQG